jgi:thiol-disulfide isomerase/thioredoxin/Tfp pilus assembly protein PilF
MHSKTLRSLAILPAVTTLVALLIAGPALAVSIGEQAAPITITDWVKGKPMDVLKDGKGKVIIVEFWATWCPPCIELIPETTEFYQKHKGKDLVVVGLTDMGRGQTLKTVQDFVARQGDKMNYPVAFDSTQRTTIAYQAYGLPHAVVIGKDGRIVWTGHPGMPQMKQLVVDMLEGRTDSDAAIKQAELAQRVEQMMNDLYTALQQGQVEEALAVTDRMLEADPANFDALQFRVALYVEELGAIDRLREWVDTFIEARKNNAEALAKTAHLMLAIPNVSQRQPDLAVKAARAAYAADEKSFEIAQSVALIYFEIGDLATAKRYQQRAVELAANDPAAEDAKAVLKFFETCQSLHEAPAQATPASGQ